MFRIEKTKEFEIWLDDLRDRSAKVKIATRLLRIEAGLLGDCKTLRRGISEVRVDHGPGYRLYFTMREQVVIILLCGSDKRDQKRAISLAQTLAETV